MPWLKIIVSRTCSLTVLHAGLSRAPPDSLLLRCAASDGARTLTSREAHCLIELCQSVAITRSFGKFYALYPPA